ncbi:ABC transporter permease [Tengunoibacter tsumagoiensis]|uniref:Multidrug ABC transporter permease n=1 Tax=Tengunoibacter tsumagoiensis TaxID=2014871 RepID=A0A402A844_9CHLR|nr:ABC transporter permease [Tengunoibacter tsumagoiensis]GCE15176.1 multidrug ABC transporter permease [Tengunoibacter tsumagoiensis]
MAQGKRQAAMPVSFCTSSIALENPRQRLTRYWRIIMAEMLKQHRMLFGGKLIYCSMLLWPALELGTAYYTFQPLAHAPGLRQHWPLAADARAVMLFFITGMLAYVFYWSLVQSSWMFSRERFEGTLEMMFLTPANRLVLMLANGTAALFQSVWLFLTFTVGLMALVGGLHMSHPMMLVLAFLSLFLPAMAWAVFLNSFCIFARDSSFFYSLLEPTMSFLSAVRLPPFVYPLAVRVVGSVLPLTTSLIILRAALLEGATLMQLMPQLVFLMGLTLVLFVLAAWALKRGEEHARHTGSLSLF